MPSSGSSLPEVEIDQCIDLVGQSGITRYYIPAGNLFLDAAGETSLTLNGVAQTFGVDYTHAHRINTGIGENAETVHDASIGFNMTVAPQTGDTLDFCWKERRILVKPYTVLLARMTIDISLYELDHQSAWLQSGKTTSPNSVGIPSMPSQYVAEFWRLSNKRGGTGTHGIFNNGRRYMPYRRGPQADSFNSWYFHQDWIHPSGRQPWRKFRVAYYNTETGARSELCDEVIVSSKMVNDSLNGLSNTRRTLWLTR